MKITYEKFDNYYVFSHDPKNRVYLGDLSPEDYIEDELNQQKRSASSWYKEVHTGKEVTWKEIMKYKHDQSMPGNGMVWYDSMNPFHEIDDKKNYTWEGGCTFDFQRKVTGLATFGNGKRSATYVKQFRSEAWAYVSDTTLERQKEIEAQTQARIDEFNRDHPWLVNLHDRLGHVDDDGKPISADQHVINMKARYGDDVFEKAEAKIDPKIKEMADKFISENKELMKSLVNLEDKEKSEIK